ncbi:MAG: hypothetical protein A3E87_00260 [Gammaproteobacteria bacterium RIFCSPHIGHO2_12_FULL_35_23]|nr:MAG: hypothetical protein A3E87_00260 [Gammaproteobacteria bacterium RIFCSPHIGHO2_12_FULL_35_23]
MTNQYLILKKLRAAKVSSPHPTANALKKPGNFNYNVLLQFLQLVQQIVIKLSSTTSSDEKSGGGSNLQGMTLKPEEGFLTSDQQLKLLLRNIELMLSRLEKIKHFLESEVEHDPSLIHDAILLAKKLSRDLKLYDRKFKNTTQIKSSALYNEVKQMLFQTHRLDLEIYEKILNLKAGLLFNPRPNVH